MNKQSILDPCLPKSWVRAFDVTLVATAVALTAYSIYEFRDIRGDSNPEVMNEKMKILGSTVSLIGVLLWPVVWNYLVGYSVIVHRPLTLFGFLWPMVINILDLISINGRDSSETKKVFGMGSITADANTLVGVAFAIGSLLSSQSDTKLANATIPLIMYSLLLMIAFIVPTPSLDPNSYEGFTTGGIQRVFFNYAMGLVITGISINVSTGTGRGLQKVIRTICSEGMVQTK